MNRHSVTSGSPPTRAPVFFWITIGLLALFLLGGAAGVLLLVFEAKSINRSGGWGWILVGAIYVVSIIVVSFGCALCTAVSLCRGESHRRLSLVILIISGLVVSAFVANFIRGAIDRSLQHAEVARRSANTMRPPAAAPRHPSMPPSAAKRSNAPVLQLDENGQIQQLKAQLWEAIRTKNAAAFIDCFYFEERFNTPEIRQENRDQVEILLRGETTDVEVLDIPDMELVEIMKIQHAKPASRVRYSLFPIKLLRIWQEGLNGRVGRTFLIGEKNGKWYIITLAGHTT